MKYLVKLFVITFFSLICTNAFAEQKVVYVDMKYILNNSKAGKGAQDYLQKSFKNNQKKFADTEKNLKKEEEDLLSKKTVLSKEDYKRESDQLRKKVLTYQSERRTAIEKITNERRIAREKLLKALNPIVNEYIQENDIAFVIDKKNVLGGQSSLDITKEIIEKLNKKLPSVSLN